MTPLKITRGDTRTFFCDVEQPIGTPLNLTGYTAWFTIKNAFTDLDAAALVKKGMTGGLTGVTLNDNPLLSPTVHNRIAIALAPTDTSGFAAKPLSFWYDVQIKDGSGNVYTVARGPFLVDPDVTITTT